MKDILKEQKPTFEIFADYFQNIRQVVSIDEQGNFTDPYGNDIRSFKLDRLGNLIGMAVSTPFGPSTTILSGHPGGEFDVQGNDGDRMFRYIFQSGYCVFERQSDRKSYVETWYGKNSEGRPIARKTLYHGGPSEEKRWSEDGTKLVYKKVSFLDKNGARQVFEEHAEAPNRVVVPDLSRMCVTR